MKESFGRRKENKPIINSDERAPAVQDLSFAKIPGSDILRFVCCNGVDHWTEDRIDTGIVNRGERIPCDCPDLNNRKSVWDIFKE